MTGTERSRVSSSRRVLNRRARLEIGRERDESCSLRAVLVRIVFYSCSELSRAREIFETRGQRSSLCLCLLGKKQTRQHLAVTQTGIHIITSLRFSLSLNRIESNQIDLFKVHAKSDHAVTSSEINRSLVHYICIIIISLDRLEINETEQT